MGGRMSGIGRSKNVAMRKSPTLEMIRLTPLFMRTILTELVGGSDISELTVNLLDLVCSTHMGTGGDDD
jgi:hypothetical protein